MFSLILLFCNYNICSGQGNIYTSSQLKTEECPEDKPIFNKNKGECTLEYCQEEDYLSTKCIVANPIIKKQWLNTFLYSIEDGSPIYSSFGRSAEGDIAFESSLGNPYSQKNIFTYKSDGREYIDGLLRNEINLDSNLYSRKGNGVIVTINNHKCYLKLSNYESVEMYDFDDKKYTSAKLEDILGYKILSEKNSLLITSQTNTFVLAYITSGNYLIMQKFQVVSNDASNCIIIIKTLKENVKTFPKDSRRCMITKNQYIECLDMNENQIYVIRVYNSNLNFVKEYELERNTAPADRAIYTYHETVWLKNEMSIFIYYNDITENNAKPILVLKNLNSRGNLLDVNQYLKKDTVFGNVQYRFSDTENSLAIFNEYYFGLASLTEDRSHLIVALFNIFNSDYTIDTHYFDIPLRGLYDINYESGLQAFGYKNAYGVQMNYFQNNAHRSGFIVFGYANTTDPAPINRLFDYYNSYTIKIGDYYKGIENNIFCYVFVSIKVMEIPSSAYFTVKNKKGTIKVGDSLTLDDELTITRRSTTISIPKGRYVLGLAPYLNEADYEGFVECSFESEMFGQEVPTDWYPDEYYGRTIEFKFTVGIDCFENCDSCTNKGLSLDDQKCDTCKNGYYFVENTQNCFAQAPDGYYFNRDKKVYSKCYDNCKTCSTINTGKIQNCLSCKENFIFYRHTNCLNCKYLNKYVNYEQTECIDSVPVGFYVNDTNINTIDKCHPNCLTCHGGSSNDEDMKCLTCDNANSFYLVENTNNCHRHPYPGYYLDENILKKCYKACLTCSGNVVVNGKNKIINMNCDTCDESNGFYLIPGTKNCEDRNQEYGDKCPEDKPILKNNKCVLEYCTEEEYEKKVCNVSSPVIKKQWIGDFTYITHSEIPIYSTLGKDNDGALFFESNLGNPLSDRKIYTLKENGRGYIDGVPGHIIDFNSSLYSKDGNGAIVKINGHKCYLRLSYHESIELYDFNEEKYTSAKLEDILGYKIVSYKNSLLRTNEENTFIYAYITTGNNLIMQKFKVVSNDASNCIQLIKTLKEDVKTISKDSRRCLITFNQFVECLDMDENQMYVIRIYNSYLNFLKQYQLEKNNAPADKAFNTYHEAMWLKGEIGVFIYYNDISEKNARPILVLKQLNMNNGEVELENLNDHLKKDIVSKNVPYTFSDSENSIARFNDYYFALASITESNQYNNKHLIISLFNIFNDDKTIHTHYFDVPIKDLYDVEYYSGLQAFGYKNGYGVQFNHKKKNEYRTGFILFGYGNTKDPEFKKNLFDFHDTYTIRPYDYVKLENNVFCYVLKNIIITELPDPSTGIKVLKSSNSQQLKVGDALLLNDEIKITYTGNKDDIPRGKYVVGFTPYSIEAETYEEYYECSTDIDMFGEQVPTVWNSDEYYGRTAHFEFTSGSCFDNCETCITKGPSLNDQKCQTCLKDYYFVEDTQNCFKYPPDGYYFNKDKLVHSKCYDKCKTCSKLNVGNIHNCLSCYPNYLLYNSTNCLNCKYNNKYANYEQTECIDSVPIRFYVNNTEYNTIDKCHPRCLTCNKGSNDDNNMNCLTCDNANGFYLVENTNNCERDPYPGYYLDVNILRKCHISCERCSAKPIFNEEGDVINCDSCNKEFGFYPIEGTNICTNNSRGDLRFDENCTCYKVCYKDCLTCSAKELDKYHMNCLTCDASKGFTYFPRTTNCLNCKVFNKYVNYYQTECIDYVPDGFYVNNTEINTIDKCHKNCLACNRGSKDDNNMNCLKCDNFNGFYFVENTTNCHRNPYPEHYLDINILRRCHKYCSSCSASPIVKLGKLINMNCDTCNEAKGYYLIPGTKNCEDKNAEYDDDNCPVDRPVAKDKRCVLEYCTKEEYNNKKCNVSNYVIKKQWIGDFPYVSEMNRPLYSTFGQISNSEIIFESNLGNPFTNRKIYTLNENGRGYIDGVPGQIINLNSSYFSTYGNGAIVKINGHKCYLRLSNFESIEMYDLDEKKYTSANLENVLGYKIESYKNSLLRTNEENTFIYAYITTGNYLIMQKFKVVSNDAKNCLQLIKTSLESVKTISKNSRRCMITVNQFVECLDMDENQIYVIRIYDRDLNYLKQYQLEKNKAPCDRAYYTYHEAVWYRAELAIFVYYNDISDNNARPIFMLKELVSNNSNIELIDHSSFISKEKIYNNLPYYISDSENSLAVINDYYFALATITSYESRHLLIALFNTFNDDNTINVNYFDVPFKDLYDIDYYANLQSFGYKNGFGVQFDHKKGEEYRTGFILFGYGNTTDPTPINNLFSKQDSYTFKPYNYIKVVNNVFCYVLVNIVITELPNPSTGIIVFRTSNSQELRVGDILSLNDEVTIKYNGNKDDIPRGKYIVGFKPYLNEPDEEEFYECMTDLDIFGENVPTYWRPDEYYGRTAHFVFTMGECFNNCKTCVTKGSDINNQKCESCLTNYYFVEGTKNCFEFPPDGYYFNEVKEVHSKCYDTCKTCSKLNIGKIHNCLSCKPNHLLYNNTNCLDCKYRSKYVNYEQTECIDYVPNGFYVNNTEYNTIDKCHKNCLTCSKGSNDDNNMNCLTCDNTRGLYLVENTNNCERNPYPGHYLDDNILRKCHIACAKCSKKPIINEKGEVTNCDACNKDLGFYPEDNTNICKNKTKEGEYFDDDCLCYKKCYKDCLTCSGKAINEYHMNCLSCYVSKGFIYFPKTTNCLNCKAQSKYINYEQTECIDEVPKGYYVNNSDINSIDKCYPGCRTCSKGGTSPTSMNCLTCEPSLYLKNGNCVKTYTCPYKFFYQIKIDKNADLNQKICLDENEICPCALPFYYTQTNECVESCPLELLLYQGCKISNVAYGLNKIIVLVKLYFSQGLIDTLTKHFSLSDINYYYNFAVKLSVYSLFSSFSSTTTSFFRHLDVEYQSLANDNITSINQSKYFEGSDVVLGQSCEKKLREYYNIPDDVPLTIIKIDFKRNDSTLNNVQYEVFNPKNRTERLDLSLCKEEKILIKSPIDSSISLNKISLMMDSPNIGEENQFFKDECSIFTSEYGTDVLLQDRIKDYNFKFCQSGCKLQNINQTTGVAECLCPPNSGFSNISITNIEEIINDNNIDNDNGNNNIEYSGVNSKVLKCAKNIKNNFYKNYILIIFTILLIGYIILSAIFLIFKRKFWAKMLKTKESNDIIETPISNHPKVIDTRDVKVEISDKIKEKTLGSKDPITPNKMVDIKEEKEIEPDMYDYSTASIEDKRKLIGMFISSIKKREIILFSFIEDHNMNIIKKLLLILTFMNYLVTNAFFFTEKNIHQIYLDKGEYNLGYQMKYIFAAVILSSIFLYIAKCFSTSSRSCNAKDVNKLEIKLYILLGISIGLYIFYWVYIGSLTSTYVNAKKHLLLNALMTFIFCCILEFVLAFISAILRYYSLKHFKSSLYSISKIINFL